MIAEYQPHKTSVEQDVKADPMGLAEPIRPGEPGWDELIDNAFRLAVHATKNDEPWPKEVVSILGKELRPALAEAKTEGPLADIEATMKIAGFHSWRQVCDFVASDEPDELWNRIAKYVRHHGTRPDRHAGHLVSCEQKDGYRLNRRFVEDSKSFPAKKHFKVVRPHKYVKGVLPCAVQAVLSEYDDHASFNARHAEVFGVTWDYAVDYWGLTGTPKLTVLVICLVASWGRNGLFVHTAQDNRAGFALGTDFKVFPEMRSK